MRTSMRAVVWSSACVLLSVGACSNAARYGGSGSAAGNSGGGAGSSGSAGSMAGQGGDAGAVAGSSGAGGSPGAGGIVGMTGAAGDGAAGSATEGGVLDGATAGAGGAGGAPGAGGLGGYGLMGASRCATAGTLLCESFENDLDATLWTKTQSGDATVAVDTMHAARGTKALHVKTPAGSGHAFITEKMTFPAMGNTLYARLFVWFGDDITTSGHFSLAEGAGSGTGALVRFGGQFKEFGVGSDGGMSGDWTDHDTVMVPSQKWICVEFQFDGAANAFHVWTDDAHRTALDSGANRHANFVMPQFKSLWFGWWMYNATEPKDLWIDEIAVDSKPIGCAK
jgi:hypothetical protein